MFKEVIPFTVDNNCFELHIVELDKPIQGIFKYGIELYKGTSPKKMKPVLRDALSGIDAIGGTKYYRLETNYMSAKQCCDSMIMMMNVIDF